MANSCETCKHYEVEPYHEPCVSCRFRDYDVPTKWENPFKQKTNADRIRAMTDEELAWELMTWRLETEAKHQGIESNYPNTQKSILEWLKQPAEV
jgi:hypothetical protein